MQACCGIVNINICNSFTSLDVYFFSVMERWWLCEKNISTIQLGLGPRVMVRG